MLTPKRLRCVRKLAAATTVVVVATLGLAAIAGANTPPRHPSATATRSERAQAGPYLLALGDSLAAGYQPSDGESSPPVDPVTGFPTRAIRAATLPTSQTPTTSTSSTSPARARRRFP